MVIKSSSDEPSAPDTLRARVVECLGRLNEEGVRVIHDLAQEIELRSAWEDFSEGMTLDWQEGKFAKLDEALASARETIRASSAQ